MDHGTAGLPAAAEGRHPTGEGPWWCERWWFDWSRPSGDAGFVELALLPNQRRAWYRAALIVPGQPLLAVVDHDAPVPRVGLELRSTGLWADHTVESPFRQWTVANEAFALAVDDPDELTGRAYGTPVPLAFDVEWYAAGPPVPRSPGGTAGYAQVGEVDGLVDRGGGRRDVLAGTGRRLHEWGPLRLPDADDRPMADGAPARVPDRWPAPFDVVVTDLLGTDGWRRRLG